MKNPAISRTFKISSVLIVFALVLGLFFSLSLSLRGNASTPPAWAPGVAYTVNQQVTYQNNIYHCVQAHTSQTGWEPPNVPALWTLDGPVTGATNTPAPATATKAPPTATKAAATATKAAATATKTGATNTPVPPTATKAAATNTPAPTATASSGGCGGYPAWDPNGHAYSVGDIVCYNGSTYKCIQAHTSQAGWDPVSAASLWTLVNSGPTPTTGPTATTGPTNTPGPTSTPCSNCGGSLPKHIITGYWQDFDNGAKDLRLSDVPSSYNLIAVAFADADSNNTGGVTFSIDSTLASKLGGYSESQFIADIKTLHGQGRKVIISVGGQNGSVTVNDATSASNFANSVHGLMQKYGFDGVDIDLENGINAQYMTSALQSLSNMAGSGLIITLAPQTIDIESGGTAYMTLAKNIKSILTVMNTQFYNSGSMNGCDGNVYSQGNVDFLTALQCIPLQNGLRPDQVGFGLPANSSGAGSGAVDPSIVNNALDCLETKTNCGKFVPSQTYPGIRGAMDWSINWDANNNYNFASTVSGHFSSLP